jgi:hypothetical protein
MPPDGSIVKALSTARRRITDQANVVTIFLTVVVSAVLYGWIEGTLYPFYPLKDEFVIANHFTWYHVVFLSLFLVIGFSVSVSRTLYTGLRKYYLLFASAGSVAWGFWIEDMSYFATRYPTEILVPGVWVEWGLSGFYFAGHWIPFIYAVLCSGGFALFGFAFLVAKRDPVAFRLQPLEMARRQVTKLLVSHSLPLILFAVLVEMSNLAAASMTNVGVAFSVPERLGLILAAVVIFPLLLLLVMDAISSDAM